jgi:hypothetical protein
MSSSLALQSCKLDFHLAMPKERQCSPLQKHQSIMLSKTNERRWPLCSFPREMKFSTTSLGLIRETSRLFIILIEILSVNKVLFPPLHSILPNYPKS